MTKGSNPAKRIQRANYRIELFDPLALRDQRQETISCSTGAGSQIGVQERVGAQRLFLRKMRGHAPRVLIGLVRGPYQDFLRISQPERIELHDVVNEHVLSKGTITPTQWMRHTASATSLRLSLEHWADSWFLNADWFQDQALATMVRWEAPPFGAPRTLDWVMPPYPRSSLPPISNADFVYHFPMPVYDPQIISREAMLTLILRDVALQLEKHFEVLEQVHDPNRSLQEIQQKPALERHLEWLVMYQVLGMSQDEIAETVFLTKKAIGPALHETSELIGLPLRTPGRAGRRPKQ